MPVVARSFHRHSHSKRVASAANRSSHKCKCTFTAFSFAVVLASFWPITKVDCDNELDARRPPTKRRVARVDGDVIIGALFPVHRLPSITGSYTRQCGEVNCSSVCLDLTSVSTIATTWMTK